MYSSSLSAKLLQQIEAAKASRSVGPFCSRYHVPTDRLVAGGVVSIFVLLSTLRLGATVLQLVPEEASHLPSRQL